MHSLKTHKLLKKKKLNYYCIVAAMEILRNCAITKSVIHVRLITHIHTLTLTKPWGHFYMGVHNSLLYNKNIVAKIRFKLFACFIHISARSLVCHACNSAQNIRQYQLTEGLLCVTQSFYYRKYTFSVLIGSIVTFN